MRQWRPFADDEATKQVWFDEESTTPFNISGWVNVLEYLGPIQYCGPFVVIMHHVFTFDLCARFFVTFATAFVAVSTATFVAFQTATVSEYTAWHTPFR